MREDDVSCLWKGLEGHISVGKKLLKSSKLGNLLRHDGL